LEHFQTFFLQNFRISIVTMYYAYPCVCDLMFTRFFLKSEATACLRNSTPKEDSDANQYRIHLPVPFIEMFKFNVCD